MTNNDTSKAINAQDMTQQADTDLLLYTKCCKADYVLEDPEYNTQVCSNCGLYLTPEDIIENPMDNSTMTREQQEVLLESAKLIHNQIERDNTNGFGINNYTQSYCVDWFSRLYLLAEKQERQLKIAKEALESIVQHGNEISADIALDTLRRCYPEEYVTKPQS